MNFNLRTLQQLFDNETLSNQYLRKKVLVDFVAIKEVGNLQCCASDGIIWIANGKTLYTLKQNKVDDDDGLRGIRGYHMKQIKQISLISDDNDSDDDDDEDEKINDKNYNKNSTSITNEIFDLLKLKLVEHALSVIATCGSLLDPLNVFNRKSYLKETTDLEMKQQIGGNITEMVIPNDINKLDSTMSAMIKNYVNSLTEDTMGAHQSPYKYNEQDVLSLIYNYHQLWIKHINEQQNKEKENENKDNEMDQDIKENKNEKPQLVFRQNYIDWDDRTFRYQRSNNDPQQKAKNVFIPSVWPYFFNGPCKKLRKNDPDWRCMVDVMPSHDPLVKSLPHYRPSLPPMPTVPTLPYQLQIGSAIPLSGVPVNPVVYPIGGIKNMINTTVTTQVNPDDDPEIVYYKSRRTDCTVEICEQCIKSLLAKQDTIRLGSKSLFASNKKSKRMRKKIRKQFEQGMNYIPPTNIRPYRGKYSRRNRMKPPMVPIPRPIRPLPVYPLPHAVLKHADEPSNPLEKPSHPPMISPPILNYPIAPISNLGGTPMMGLPWYQPPLFPPIIRNYPPPMNGPGISPLNMLLPAPQFQPSTQPSYPPMIPTMPGPPIGSYPGMIPAMPRPPIGSYPPMFSTIPRPPIGSYPPMVAPMQPLTTLSGQPIGLSIPYQPLAPIRENQIPYRPLSMPYDPFPPPIGSSLPYSVIPPMQPTGLMGNQPQSNTITTYQNVTSELELVDSNELIAVLDNDTSNNKPLTAEMLADQEPAEIKRMIGERLFVKIQVVYPRKAGKITGMLLEMDNEELLKLLSDQNELMKKINEANNVLCSK